MRTVISTSHPDPGRQPRDSLSLAPPLDQGTLDPALNDEHIPYPPDTQPAVPPTMQMVSTSASPPPQYIATGTPGQPPADGEWGDVPRLPPILQVEKQHVTTTATQAASASRRRNDAQFKCPVPGCGSTFTRRFNLRGHLRSHTEERPFVCEWPGCTKGFARQHDCKRHYALHNAKPNQHLCEGCGKTFSRTDALNRHLRSDGGSNCRKTAATKAGPSTSGMNLPPPVPVSDPADGHPPPPPGTLNGHYPISLAVNGPPPGPTDPNVHHMHPHQLPPELNPQFLAGLLSGQQFLAAAAAANDPNHQAPPPHGYEGIIQGAPAPPPASEPAPEPEPEPESAPAAEDEASERPTKRRAVSIGSEIVPVPVQGSGTEASEPLHELTTEETKPST